MAVIKPILRMFDYDKAMAFYVDWLGFTVDWEHVFEEGAPKYIQVSRGDVIFHLSEHHGDGSPGVHLHIDEFKGLKEYHRELIEKKYKYNRPGLEVPFWNEKAIIVTVIDPVGNQLTFQEVLE